MIFFILNEWYTYRCWRFRGRFSGCPSSLVVVQCIQWITWAGPGSHRSGIFCSILSFIVVQSFLRLLKLSCQILHVCRTFPFQGFILPFLVFYFYWELFNWKQESEFDRGCQKINWIPPLPLSYLLRCPLYAAERAVFLSDLLDILEPDTIVNLNDNDMVNLFLFGNEEFPYECNVSLASMALTYIHSTKRFDDRAYY